MKKLYDKNPLTFALIWIGIYCVVQSFGNLLSAEIGVYESANAVLGVILAVFLLVWLRENGLFRAFGLCKPTQPAGRMLFYLPLILICTRDLWNGVTLNLSPL